MVDVVIPDLDDHLLRCYQQSADASGISLEEEIHRTLTEYAKRLMDEAAALPKAEYLL